MKKQPMRRILEDEYYPQLCPQSAEQSQQISELTQKGLELDRVLKVHSMAIRTHKRATLKTRLGLVEPRTDWKPFSYEDCGLCQELSVNGRNAVAAFSAAVRELRSSIGSPIYHTRRASAAAKRDQAERAKSALREHRISSHATSNSIECSCIPASRRLRSSARSSPQARVAIEP